jgi:hypothetical protein
MSGAWHGGKGSDQRAEAVPGSFRENYPTIDWNAREREAQAKRVREAGFPSFAGYVACGLIEILDPLPEGDKP